MTERLFDELSEGILKIDEGLVIVQANRAARAILGEIDSVALPDGLHVQGISKIVDCFISGVRFETDTTYVKDDTTLYLRILVTPPYIVFRNITGERLFENAKMDFVNSIVHEFSTPLAVINGYIQLLIEKQDEIPDDVTQTIERISRSANRLARLVEELGILSNLELQNYRVKRETVNLRELVEEAIGDLESKWKRKKIQIEFSVSQDIYACVDSLLLFRIISNLLSNAVKYSGVGDKIQISSRESEKRIFLSVKDNGIGIKSEELPRIFERFYRASNAKTSGSSGLGLGLSLVKHALNLIDGTIDVRSRYMLGTTVTISLPKRI
jgi:signal transduction histidine kinase